MSQADPHLTIRYKDGREVYGQASGLSRYIEGGQAKPADDDSKALYLSFCQQDIVQDVQQEEPPEDGPEDGASAIENGLTVEGPFPGGWYKVFDEFDGQVGKAHRTREAAEAAAGG